MVRVDPDLIKQAVLNLVLNGFQAMTEGGTLTVAAQKQEDIVLIEVRDEGSGIAPELQEKVFELYFTTKKGGSGIGLAQTYQIMQWHYGSIDFESKVGAGTTFQLRLPAIVQAAESVSEATARS
jgi:signal transduction histidine kinase